MLLGISACGGGTEDAMPRSDVPEGSRGEMAVREQCNGEGREVDLDGDGRPDVRHVYASGVERCTQYDMNRDGIVDVTRFFDASGATIREEHDFDFDGRIDQISYFENGQIVRAELDTNFDNRIDTWLWCDANRLVRSERDRRHRGRPDTWEFFDAGLITEARYDENNDGETDRWETFRDGVLVEIRTANPNGGDPLVDEIALNESGGRQAVRTCDGSEPPAPPAPATSGDDSGAPEDASGGEASPPPETPSDMPWSGTADVPAATDGATTPEATE